MTKEKSIKYQDEQIRYHTKMVGYYEDIQNRGDIENTLSKEAIQDQLSYHARLLIYHKEQHGMMLTRSTRG